MPSLQCISHLDSKYAKLVDDIIAVLPKKDYDDGSYGPLLIRLAWHASGTWDTTSKTGGSNGATMQFEPESTDGANGGLDIARKLLAEKVHSKHSWCSLADLWILASYVVIETSGGPAIPFHPGRTDLKQGPSPIANGRLPDGEMGKLSDDLKTNFESEKQANIEHVYNIFVKRMGFTPQETVALIAGGHAFGRCHPDRSGYSGKWQINPLKFTNVYCKRALGDEWRIVDNSVCKKENINLGPKNASATADGATGSGCPIVGKKQHVNKANNLMMLISERAMVWDPEMKKSMVLYSEDMKALKIDFGKAFAKLTEFGCDGVINRSESKL